MKKLDDNTKIMLCNLAKDVKATFDFSLLKGDDNYRSFVEVAELMGGDVLYSERLEPAVSGQGNKFLLRIHKDHDEGFMIRSFAEALALLILKGGYVSSKPDRPDKGVFIQVLPEYEDVINWLKCSLIADYGRIRDLVNKYCDSNGLFSQSEIADDLKIDRPTVTNLLLTYELMNRI